MKFDILRTGSKGNLYVLSDSKTSIIIEAGVPIKEMKRLLDFKIYTHQAVLISHNHADHSKAVPSLIKSGLIDCYMSAGAKYALFGDNKHHRIKIVEAGEVYEIGTMKIIPFDTEHDAVDPLGYVIKSDEDGDVMLFITDAKCVPNIEVKNLSMVAVECNYDNSSIMKNYYMGALDEVIYKRITNNHAGLDDVLSFLEKADISKVREIILLHESKNNCNINMCAMEIEEATGIKTTFYGDLLA